MNEPSLKTGIYRHYKGNLYRVYGVARHSETDEYLVVYQPQYGERKFWVRPAPMFMETVTVDGVTQPRFAFESPSPDEEHTTTVPESANQSPGFWRRLLGGK